jgi:ribosomal-protein-alanine N-acetyltransferase
MESKGEAAGLAQIRPGRREDAPQLTQILQESPETVDWIADPGSPATLERGLVLVGESQDQITGVLVGRQIADQAEILNIAVRRSRRRRGVGSALVAAALKAFGDQQAGRVFLEVRESNAPAIAFYEKHGFRQVARRPAYYRQPDEAALILQRELTG